MSETIHLHKNIMDRKRNTIILFLPTILFISFLIVLFSISKVQDLSKNNLESTLGTESKVDNGIELDRK